MLVLMEDLLAGCCCPGSPLENRISGFHAHISNISLSNAIHVLCACFLSCGSACFVFIVLQPGSPFLLCLCGWAHLQCTAKVEQGGGSRRYPNVTAVWMGVGLLEGCMGTCSAQKSGLVALRDIPRALLPCVPGQRVQVRVRPGAEAANVGHLLDNFQSLLANGDGAVFLLAVSRVSTVPPQVTSTLCCHAALGARQAVFSLRTGTKWQISAL